MINGWVARTALGLGLLLILGLVARQVFAAAWSNHCDPGNARFNLVKGDPVVTFHAPGELFAWESDGPDNLWTCGNPSLTVDHVGSDVSGMYEATRAEMTSSGWTSLNLGEPVRDFALYQKDTKGGVRLTAVVIPQTAWVEVDLSAPGLHPGENGF